MCERDGLKRRNRREEGSSLIEVLIALFILMVLSLGVIQMFSVAHMMNMGASARTQMTYKCEQVMENVRFGMALITDGGAAPLGSGVQKASYTFDLPYTASDFGYAYWGPAGANVVEAPNEPYRLSYTVAAEPDFWLVTVTTTPADPNVTAGASRYIGMGISGKRVTYVARIPQ